MKRTLTLSTLLSLSAASQLALALGLGDAQVGSTIDSPLRATVPLLAAPADMDPDRVNVTIASAGAFEAVGMTLTPVAKGVRAEVKRRNGTLVLDLASQSPVTEPWLDLLLEFQTPDGKREVRELTLLLDPPGYSSRSTLVRAAGQSVDDDRVASADTGSSPSAAVPGPEISSSRSQAEAAAPASGGVASTVIRSGDTLWSLAEKMRPSRDVTVKQTIVALVKSNPEAFPTGNANVMKTGATLRLPSQDVLTDQTHGDAVRQLSIMERSWMSGGASRPALARASSGASNAAEAAASAEDARELARQTEMAVQTAQAAQQAVAPASSEEPDQGTRLTLLTDAQTDADVDRLLASGGEGLQVQVAPSVLNAVLDSGESEEVDRTRRLERLEELEQKWQENQRVLSAIRAERDALRDEVVNLRDQITQLRIQVERLVTHQENQGLMPTLSNMYEGVLERPLVLGGSALAALLFLLALARRRPRETDSLKREVAGVQAPVVPPSKSAQSEQVKAGVQAVDEIDTSIAHGRYDQARQLLELSLKKEPQRDDLRLKLLMVQLERGDQVAAWTQAERLKKSSDASVRQEAEQLMSRNAASQAAARSYAKGEDFHSRAGANAAASVVGVSGKKDRAPDSDSSFTDAAASDAVPSDDFDARIQQLSATGRGSKTDEQRAAVFEVSESPDEQEPAAEKSEDGAAGEPAIIDYQPVKVDSSAAADSSSDDDAAAFKQEVVDYQPGKVDTSLAAAANADDTTGSVDSFSDKGSAKKSASVGQQTSVEYEVPNLKKMQASTADAAGKSESLKQPGVAFTPQPAVNETSVAKVVAAPFGEPSSFSQSTLPEGFKVEVVEYPLQDSSISAPANEKKTPGNDS